MEWFNTTILIALVVYVLYQRKEITALTKDLIAQKERLTSQDNILASGKDMLMSGRDILASQKEVLDSLKEYIELHIPKHPWGGDKVVEEGVQLRQQREIAEETSRFEKEVRTKTKTLEWYEKEFSVGLNAMFQLLQFVPLGMREKIIGKMPNSVIKKGVKRLSDKM